MSHHARTMHELAKSPLIDKCSICAVIVTYHPDEGFPKRIEQIVSQVGQIVIVDNGSSEKCINMLRGLSTKRDIHLILNGRNLGIATALNQGFGYSLQRGYKWVMTLDDDSTAGLGMVNSMIAVWNSFPENERIGVIGPNPSNSISGISLINNQYKPLDWIEQKVIITSGSLFPARIFEKIGPFRDDFFIDCVDQEYCLRLRRNGYLVIIACRAVLIHSLGKPKVHRFLWRHLIPTNHSPGRRYYITRNGLVIAKNYFFSDPAWVVRHLMALVKSTVKVVLLENDKAAKLKSIAIGVWHALTGRMGPYHTDGGIASCGS